MVKPRSPDVLPTATRVREVLRYEPDEGHFYWLANYHTSKIGKRAGTLVHNGYWRIGIDGELYLAHRIAWVWMTGEWPSALVDHVNGDTGDNRWVNLRAATHRQNRVNSKQPRTASTAFKGVRRRKTGWQVVIKLNDQNVYLGVFPDLQAAKRVFANAHRAAHGQFSRV